VLSTPPHESTAPVCGSSQTLFPGLNVDRAQDPLRRSSGACLNEPPMKPLPPSHSMSRRVKTPHLSLVCT
jgi:hypothetical protein